MKLSCKQASELRARAEQEPLPLTKRMQLWFHVRACRCCTHFERQLSLLVSAARKYQNSLVAGDIEPPHRLSEEAKARLSKGIERSD